MATVALKGGENVSKNNVIAKVTTQQQKNGFLKSFNTTNFVKSDSEASIKMGQVSAGAANTVSTRTLTKTSRDNSIAGSTNSLQTSFRPNDHSSTQNNQEIKSLSQREKGCADNKLSTTSKTEIVSDKLPSGKGNVQTIDLRDLQRVFKQSDGRPTSTPPLPPERKVLKNNNASIKPNVLNKQASVSTDVRKSTSTSNVSSYLSTRYQEIKDRPSSYRYTTKPGERPLSSQSAYHGSTSLIRTRSQSQSRRYSGDSTRRYSVEKSLEILKSPSSKMTFTDSSSSSTRPVSTPIISKVGGAYKFSTGKIGDHKLSSSQVSELWSGLNEEQSTATHVSEMLESEISERMKLEKEVQELQGKCSQIQHKKDRMEMEVMEARTYRTSEINGDMSDDDETNSVYRQKYERATREIEITKRRLQQQHEEEIEHHLLIKKAADKKLAEALEDVEEERRVSSQWKRKAQKANSEIQDQRIMLEEQMARNAELEKKQRKFDAELSIRQEEITKERFLREKIEREKDMLQREKYSLEQELHSTRLDMEMQSEKIVMLHKELEELAVSSRGEEEVTQLKRVKQELERKLKDQEEELEEYTGQLQLLEQVKLRLEMSLEKTRQEHRREISVKEEEIEEIRAAAQKKIKNLEAQLETEQEERHQTFKQKHELERRIIELSDQPPPRDPEVERRLRRDLKRTKALLRDAQMMLERLRDGQASKSIIRQLKNQLEDAEFTKTAAIKARQGAEMELQDLQCQFEEIARTKCELESRCLQLSREKNGLQTQLEEMEEELAEVMKKYKAVVYQMSSDQKLLTEQNQQISELEAEKQSLKEQLSDLSHKVEHLSAQPDDTHKVHHLEGKLRDQETRLELEQSTRARLESQLHRLKEQAERAREECDSLRNKEAQSLEATRKLQRQLREAREDYMSLQQKESEAFQKQHELEMALENAEADLQVTKNDLRLACQRIQDLQHALEDDGSSGTDVAEDSGSESDGSMDLSSVQGHRHYVPINRHDSLSSVDGGFEAALRMSRTPSVDHESSFSRWTRRQISMGELSLH